jgi:hypothetical protein
MTSDQESAMPEPTFTPRYDLAALAGSMASSLQANLWALNHVHKFLTQVQSNTQDPFSKGKIQANLEMIELEYVHTRESLEKYNEWKEPPFLCPGNITPNTTGPKASTENKTKVSRRTITENTKRGGS